MDNLETIMDYIVKNESSKTVGILLKRVELAVDQAKKENREYLTFKELDLLKAEQREIIYEAYRNLRDFLNAGKLIIKINNK